MVIGYRYKHTLNNRVGIENIAKTIKHRNVMVDTGGFYEFGNPWHVCLFFRIVSYYF